MPHPMGDSLYAVQRITSIGRKFCLVFFSEQNQDQQQPPVWVCLSSDELRFQLWQRLKAVVMLLTLSFYEHTYRNIRGRPEGKTRCLLT